MSKWAERFIQMAEFVSQWSKDPSTKCGAVIVGDDNEVLATGFNGFPRGVAEEDSYMVGLPGGVEMWEETQLNERWERPGKYEWVVHAELNAICNAARSGVRLKGATMYFNYSVDKICNECVKAIIQSGITKVVGVNRVWPGKGRYAETSPEGRVMVQERGLVMEDIDADV